MEITEHPASLFLKAVIWSDENLGANSPNYSYPCRWCLEWSAGFRPADGYNIGCVYSKGLRGFGGIVIWTYSFWPLHLENQRTLLVHWSLLCIVAVVETWLFWTATYIEMFIIATALGTNIIAVHLSSLIHGKTFHYG